MAETVYILGAGASRHMNAPLMTDFIDRIEAVYEEFGSKVSIRDFERVIKLVHSDLPQLAARSVVDLGNIESVFGLVEMAKLIGRLPGVSPGDDAQAQIDDVARAMRVVLAETIEMACVFPLDGNGGVTPSSTYRSLVNTYTETQGNDSGLIRPGKVAFITFNYDLGLDYALHWSNNKIDYGMKVVPNGVPHGVPLLKLHGSLHWVTTHGGDVVPLDFAEIVHHLGRASRNGKVTHALLRPTALASSLVPTSDPLTTPAIVPPSWNKTQYHRTFARIWERAAHEIAEARSIVIAGYSAGGADAFFRDLLALAIGSNDKLRKLIVVDTSPEVIARLRKLVGPALDGRFESVEHKFEEWIGPLKQR